MPGRPSAAATLATVSGTSADVGTWVATPPGTFIVGSVVNVFFAYLVLTRKFWSWQKITIVFAFAAILIPAVLVFFQGANGIKVYRNPEAFPRAWAFLLKAQKEDGSWYVVTRQEAGNTSRFSSYMGTAWATIGLVRSLPE